MKLVIQAENPSIVRLIDFEDPYNSIKESLTYTDKAAMFEHSRFKKMTYLIQKLGPEKFEEQVQEKKAAIKKSLLFQDKDGYYTYAGLASYLSKKLKIDVDSKVRYPKPKKVAWLNVPPYQPYEYQTLSHDSLLEVKHGGVEIGCHRKGQKVIMSDGSLLEVENVKVGDKLLGPDSKPRTVLELKRGTDSMYRLKTVNGQEMYVNGNHLLVLKRTNKSNGVSVSPRKDYKGKNPTKVLTVNDYLKQSDTFKHLYKTFSVSGVEFEHKQVPLDPYFLGVLLGDGSWSGTPAVTTADEKIVQVVEEIARDFNLRVRKNSKEGSKASSYFLVDDKADRSHPNHLTQILRDMGVWGTECSKKAIPQLYLANSKRIRLELLAGLIDTDGSFSEGCFDFISKSKELSDGLAFLARSVGLRATERTCQKHDQNGTVGTYYRVTLSGDIDCVPTRLPRKKAGPRKQVKSPNMFGFTLTKMSDKEDYYGFVLDQDHLYLTDTFLVTHNTGLGKTFIIQNLLRTLGLKTIVMTPATNISEQIYDNFVKAFGKKLVGRFFDGKKESGKLFVIANAQSLTKVTEGTEHWDNLRNTQVFIADESHQCPASTLESVCFGVAALAPYRFFFSATQMRNDGRDLLLDGITGQIVYRKSVEEGVREGFLSKPIFRVVNIPSASSFESRDANEMTRKHLYYNDDVVKRFGQIVNQAVDNNMPVVVLIEEVEQFTRLLPFLRHRVGFAHGPLGENKAKVPEPYWDSDPSALVKEFNQGKLPILVGTSCISTGTDIQAVKLLVYWQGGKSEIQVKQAIGRTTRKYPGKTFCTVIDAKVYNVPVLESHALRRMEIYHELFPDVKEIQ